MVTINKILTCLKDVLDPISNKNIVDLKFIHNITINQTDVFFDVVLPGSHRSKAEEIKLKAEQAVLKLTNIGRIQTNVKILDSRLAVQPQMKNIKNIIAVSSCKGGVGKSTIAVHLAQELLNRNYKVGLIDCDIYGPSIPTLLNIHKASIHTNQNNQLVAINHHGLKVMSFGFLLGDAPAVMRGPIVTRYIQQILLNTDWGELDFLIIDMPPGTGDIHLTITQTIQLTGAVIVTTPHALSLTDVARGILMFEKVNVPIIGIIENMSYLMDERNWKHYIFGESTIENLQKRFGITTVSEIPILKELSQIQTNPKRNPYIQTSTDQFIQNLEELNRSRVDPPKINFDQQKIELTWSDGRRWAVSNFDLRLNSQDALSVDELTGERHLKAEDIRKDIAAKEITPLGNYAIGITWNDGHSAGIYPYTLIEQLAKKE